MAGKRNPPRQKHRAAYLVAACALGVSGSATQADAQVINPTVLDPAAKPPPAREVRTAAGQGYVIQIPPGAEKKFVTVRAAVIDGAFPELAAQNAGFTEGLRGKRLSVADIYRATMELQAAYTRAFPLATIAILNPDAADGVVHVAVSDGVIEAIELSGVSENTQELARGRLAPLVGRHHLTAAEYQRRTLLIGTISGVTGQVSTVWKGHGRFVLAGALIENRVSGASVISNRLPKDFGTWEFSQSFALNNALGFGEQISGAVASTPDFDRYFDGTAKSQAYSTDVVLPIGNDGLVLGAGYLSARSRATPLFSLLGGDLINAGERQAGRFDRVSARVAYPLFLTNDMTVRVQASAEHINNRYRFEPYPLGFVEPNLLLYPVQDISRDRYTVARFASEAKYRVPWLDRTAVSGLILYSRGLGGRENSDSYIYGPPLSRNSAGPVFNRLNLKARLDLGLPADFMFSAIGRMQTSFGQALMLPESFLIDGYEAVSGYASGTLNVDRGVTARGEITRPFNVELLGYNHIVAPYVFGAWGSGIRESFQSGPFRHLEASTFGGGLRTDTNFTGSPFGESLSIEFGRDRSNIPFRETGYRTNVNWVMRFAGDPFAPHQVAVATPGIFKKGPPAPAPSPIVWNGFYAGLNAGYTWDPLPEVATIGAPVSTGIDNFLNAPGAFAPYPAYWFASARGATGRSLTTGGGFLGGAQIGYNFQWNRFVAGIEIDAQGSNSRTRHGLYQANVANGLVILWNDTNGPFVETQQDQVFTTVRHTKNVDWLSTVRGRLGYLIAPTLLGYGTGGFAVGGASANSVVFQNWNGNAPLGAQLQSFGSAGSYAGTRYGWTIGAGLEWMFAPNASLKAEYLHYDLGSVNYALSPLMTVLQQPATVSNVIVPTARTQFRGDVARMGLNYHFGGNGIAAPSYPPAFFTSGFYAGLNGGYAWDLSPSVSLSASPRQNDLDQAILSSLGPAALASATLKGKAEANGFIGGGQAGYNYVHDRFVLGAEADLQGSTQIGSKNVTGLAPYTVATIPFGSTMTSVLSTKTLDWFGTLRARAGYLVMPSLLAYATGGFAYGGMTLENAAVHQTAGMLNIQSTGSVGHASVARVGWTVGGGLEWRFSPGFSLKAEYLYYDLGQANTFGVMADSLADRAVRLPNQPTPSPIYNINSATLGASARFNGQLARLGLNYHFDPVEAFGLVIHH